MLVRTANKNNSGNYSWVFGRGYSSYKSEQKAIEQDINSALLEWKKDCYFALQNGIDWKIRLGYHNQKNKLDDDIIQTISGRFGVLSVQNFQSLINNRVYTATCEVFTIYSQEPLNITIAQGI